MQLMHLTQTRPRDIEGSHFATITRIEERPKHKARITFNLETDPPALVNRDYPLSLHPRSALYALLTGLDILGKNEYKAVDLADLVGIKAQVRVARKVIATKNIIVSATAVRKQSR